MKTTLYQIRNDRFEFDSYIGSTTNFKQRESDHKKACKNPNDKRHNYPVYKFVRANGGWNEWEMIKLFDVMVNNQKELNKIERQCIEDYGGTLNVQIPGRTRKEWREQNKSIISLKYIEKKIEIASEQKNRDIKKTTRQE